MCTSINAITGILLVCISAFALAGCNINSEITNSYVDPELKKLDLEGVLVVAVTQQTASRVEFEDAFTRALRRRDVEAIASHTVLPQQKASAEAVIAAANKAGVDTILVTRYVGAKTDEIYHPGAVYYRVAPAYDPGYHGRFGGYYGRAYEVAYQQPVWTANVSHAVISDLYVVSTQGHLWQAVSETIESSGSSQVMNDTIDALIGNLKEKGLLN